MNTGFEAIFLGMDGLIYDQFEFDLFFDDKLITYITAVLKKPVSYPSRGDMRTLHTLGPLLLEPPSGIGGLAELYQDVTSTLHDQSDIFGSEIFENLHGIDVLDAVEKSVGEGYVTVAVEPMLKPATLVRIVE